MGNGDLGVMLGPGVLPQPDAYGGLSFWFTKNDFWNLAVEARDKGCRHGIGTQQLYSPNMTIASGCNITDGAGTRNSQGTAGGLLLSFAGGVNVSRTVGGYSVTEHIDNATVAGRFTLTNGAVVTTQSFVQAPATSLAAKISFLVTKVTASAAVTLDVSTGSCMPPGARCAAHSWVASTATATGATSTSTRAPPDGIRAGKDLTVAFATRVIAATRAREGEGDGEGALVNDGLVALVAGESVILVTAVASSIDTGAMGPLQAVRDAVGSLGSSDVAGMLDAHVGWWGRYWARSSIALPTRPLVETFWFKSQYTIGSSVRWNGAGVRSTPLPSPLPQFFSLLLLETLTPLPPPAPLPPCTLSAFAASARLLVDGVRGGAGGSSWKRVERTKQGLAHALRSPPGSTDSSITADV